MTIWIVLLRAVGTLVLLVGVFGGATQFLLYSSMYKTPEDLYVYVMPILQNLVYVCVCFGLASGLKHIQQSAQQVDHKLSSLGRMIAKRTSAAPMPAPRTNTTQNTQRLDLAPDAPQWEDLPEPIPYLGYVERRVERHKRMGVPLDDLEAGIAGSSPTPTYVRDEPSVARQTPGTEDQYGAQSPAPPVALRTQIPTQYVMPDEPVIDRDLLRRARDKQIRRAQAENARKGR